MTITLIGNIYNAMKEVYIKCPKCELNYITKKEKICSVCKQKMQLLSTGIVDHEKVGEMGLCPICKVNYITEDETVCSTCCAEMDLTAEEIMEMYGENKTASAVDDDIEEENDDGLNTVENEEEELEDEDLEMLNVAGIGADERDKEAEKEEEEEEEEGDDDPLADLDEELDEIAAEDDDDDEEEDDEDDDIVSDEKY